MPKTIWSPKQFSCSAWLHLIVTQSPPLTAPSLSSLCVWPCQAQLQVSLVSSPSPSPAKCTPGVIWKGSMYKCFTLLIDSDVLSGCLGTTWIVTSIGAPPGVYMCTSWNINISKCPFKIFLIFTEWTNLGCIKKVNMASVMKIVLKVKMKKRRRWKMNMILLCLKKNSQ